MIDLNSPIVGTGGTVHEAVMWTREHASVDSIIAAEDYAVELFRLCALVSFDARILFAQAAHETADFTSSWFRTRLNPAGIGITGDPAQDAASHTWKSGTEAARAHVVHMWAYAKGSIQLGHPLREYVDDDPRYPNVFDAGFAGTVRTLGDLGNGKWATDPNYAPQIRDKANAIFKEEPMSDVTFGLVPKPPIVELICSKEPNTGGVQHGYYQLAHPRQNVGVCEHITDGLGSIEFYSNFFSIGGERADDALVDYVVGRDGRIGHLNDENGTRAGWANGADDGMEGDGPAFLAHFAGELDPGNTHLISIEHEGRAADDWTGAQWNASVALDAYLFDRMGVRYDRFPVNQSIGIATHLLHSEFTGKGGNALDECPGRYLKRRINEFQAGIKAVMMAHQVTGTVTPVVPSVPWSKTDTAIIDFHGTKVLPFYGSVTARRNVPVKENASKNAKVIDTINAGETAIIRGTCRSGNTRIAFIDRGAKGVGRSSLSAFHEKWPVP